MLHSYDNFYFDSSFFMLFIAIVFVVVIDYDSDGDGEYDLRLCQLIAGEVFEH